MILKKETKKLLRKYNLWPKKYMGQNFLIDKKVIDKIIKSAELKRTDTIIEIGAGLGTLTIPLAKKVKKVIAIEKDKNLAEILKQILKENKIKNVEVVASDVLKLSTEKLKVKRNYKIVANLPFYISSPVIRKFLEKEKLKPSLMILTVQKEVAQRICAKPPHMNILAISVQLYSFPKIVKIIKKNKFWPQPKVDGAIIKIKRKKKIPKIDTKTFFGLVKAGFSSPRKKLKNNLEKFLKEKEIEKIKKILDLDQRAENIKLNQWIKTTNKLKNNL